MISDSLEENLFFQSAKLRVREKNSEKETDRKTGLFWDSPFLGPMVAIELPLLAHHFPSPCLLKPEPADNCLHGEGRNTACFTSCLGY